MSCLKIQVIKNIPLNIFFKGMLKGQLNKHLLWHSDLFIYSKNNLLNPTKKAFKLK